MIVALVSNVRLISPVSGKEVFCIQLFDPEINKIKSTILLQM